MLFYPILKLYFDFVMSLPSLLWGIVIVGLIVLGIFGFSEVRNFVLALAGGPILFYLICYVCEVVRPIPLLGIAGVVVRLLIDAAIIGSIILVIRYIMAGSK